MPNAALRFAPPQRSEQPSGGILGALLPMRRFGARPTPADGGKAKQARVYRLENGRPQAVDVTTGASDGVWTELRNGEVEPETPLVVDAAQTKK